MDIEINTKINKEINGIKINVEAPLYDEKLEKILNILNDISKDITEIIAKKGNEIYIIKLEEIYKIYASDGVAYIKTKNDQYTQGYRLYELEELLQNKGFIRISNNTIINKKYIKYFDTSIVGELIVKLKDDTVEHVSKRRIKEIIKFLRR